MADCNKGFSSSFMLLKPEEVSFIDLFHILFSAKIEDRKFVDSTATTEESFRHRWLIFISIVAQKFLMFTARPLEFLGSLIEDWLNLLSNNRNLARLILNFFTGKVVKTDKKSANFISFIGNMDKRMELDKNIKPGQPNYFPALSIMASKLSYENEALVKSTVTDHWQMEFLGCFDYYNEYQEKPTTQAFLLYDKKDEHETIVVAFRGTEPFDADAWCSDFDLSWYEIEEVGKIHGGFMKALGLQKSVGWPREVEQPYKHKEPLAYYAIRDLLKKHLHENDRARYILTGHSLGGALAILFPAILILHEETELLERLEGVYTFGQPRVGDEKFGGFMENKLKEFKVKYFRIVYGSDMVARLPHDEKDIMFKHFGTCIHYNSRYQGKVMNEESDKNYYSPLGAILMMINAIYELVRSFTISYTKGPDYKEGWFMRFFRIIGLISPGVSAHCPLDYVNCTRLGPSKLFKVQDTSIISDGITGLC